MKTRLMWMLWVGLAMADPRVHVVSPQDGQVFVPGQHVAIQVAVEPPLQAVDMSVGVYGFGHLEGTDYDGHSYRAEFDIPIESAGPIHIVPQVTDEQGETVVGDGVVVAVRPGAAPTRLAISQSPLLMSPGEKREHVYVKGEYAGGLERDIGSAEAGTSFQTTDAKVVTVDRQGEVKRVGNGIATIVVRNHGVEALVPVIVEDPAHPLPPRDVTAEVVVKRGPLRAPDKPDPFVDDVQDVTLTNHGPYPLVGPLHLLFVGKVKVYKAGSTRHVAPLGTPYLTLVLPDGVIWPPGQSLSLKLEYTGSGHQPVDWTARIIRTPVDP